MLGDSVNPDDDIKTRLSPPADPGEMPAVMLCPAGHEAFRGIWGDSNARIPFWACPTCTVVYRFQECRLVPGDEGRP